MDFFPKNIESMNFNSFWIEIFVVLIMTMLLSILAAFGLRFVSSRSTKEWFKDFIKSIKVPFILYFSALGAIQSLKSFVRFFPEIIAPTRIGEVQVVLTVIICVFFAFRLKSFFLSHVKKHQHSMDKSLIFAADKLLTIVIWVVGGLITLDSLGVPVKAILAFGGIGGFAVSWAAKDVIANFFGGLMIFIHRPFINGDWIVSSNKSFEGVVEHIGWYRTQIRTFDRRPEYIPNAVITDAIVQNPGRMYNRRIRQTIGLRYDDFALVEPIIESLRNLLKQDKNIDQAQSIMVHFLQYGSYSLDIEIYCFTKTTNWALFRDIQQHLLIQIGQIVQEHGAEFAFPTHTVHGVQTARVTSSDDALSELKT